jgi:hypothetical protein
LNRSGDLDCDPTQMSREEVARLRMAATLALYRCCDNCRTVLREQVEREEWREGS